MSLIALTGAGALAGSLTLMVGPAATRGAARHHTDYAVALLGESRVGEGLLRVGGEGLFTPRVVSTNLYQHQRVGSRFSGLLGIGGGDDRLNADLLAGPALNLDVVTLDDRRALGVRPGLRVVSGTGWTPGRLHVRFQVGTAARSLARWDFDALLGAGIGW